MSVNLAPPPLQTSLIESTASPTMTKVWYQWLLSLTTRLQTAAYGVLALVLTGQGASIPTTNLLPNPAGGLYRLSYRIRVTQAATVSSSILVTVTTSDDGVACALASPAYTGNVTNAPQSGSWLIRVDAGAPITYATTYASVGATPMLYKLDLTLEQL